MAEQKKYSIEAQEGVSVLDNVRYREMKLKEGTYLAENHREYPEDDPFLKLVPVKKVRNLVFDENYPYLNRKGFSYWFNHGINYAIAHLLCPLVNYIKNGMKVKGKENIPVNGPVIVAPNHQSFLDGPLTMAGMNWGDISNYYFYATEEHVQGSLRRWFAARHNIILMERRNLKNSIQKMAEVLRMGKNLVIFPEGRRTNTGALGDFKKTFAILSQDLNVPILPVCIRGAYDALPRERTMPSTAHIEIEYLPVVQPSEAATPEALAELVRQRINDVLGS